MKLWAKRIKDHKIMEDAVREFAFARPSSVEGWHPVITELVKPLDLACPVILKKHAAELARFSRTVFRAVDFMEAIDFDQLEIEIFPEKKKKETNLYD